MNIFCNYYNFDPLQKEGNFVIFLGFHHIWRISFKKATQTPNAGHPILHINSIFWQKLAKFDQFEKDSFFDCIRSKTGETTWKMWK
jgi:hypothetical protein